MSISKKEKARQAQENKSVALKRYELAEKYQMKTNGIINNLNFNYEQFLQTYDQVEQRTDEWFAIRKTIISATETPVSSDIFSYAIITFDS